MRLAHPLRCAEVEIHEVTKRENGIKADIVDGGLTNQNASNHVSKTSPNTIADVHKQSLIKDFNETLFTSGNRFPDNRSRSSSANSSLSGGEEGLDGNTEDNIVGPPKSRFIAKSTKKRVKRSKSKSKFYTPSPSSSIDGIDDDVGSPEGNRAPLVSPDSCLGNSVSIASTPVCIPNLGSLRGNMTPIGSTGKNAVHAGINGVTTLKNTPPMETLIADADRDRIKRDCMGSDGISRDIFAGQDNDDNNEGSLLDSSDQQGISGANKDDTVSRSNKGSPGSIQMEHIGPEFSNQLPRDNEISSPTNDSREVFTSPSTKNTYSDLIAGTHNVMESSADTIRSDEPTKGVPTRLDLGFGTLTDTSLVTEIATRQGGGPVALSRIKCLVSMTTPRDMHLCGTTSFPGFVEFNMSLDGYGCLYFPSIAPRVPAGGKLD